MQIKSCRPNAVLTLILIAVMLATSACTSSSKVPSGGEKAQAQAHGSATGAAATNPGIDLNCVLDHLQNPPESFHYLYKKDTSDNNHVHQEADVSPQPIAGFRMNPDNTQDPLHATRSDQQSWRAAIAGLTGISGMASTVAIVNHSSAMKREPDSGKVNGYDVIHYSIDTARFDEAERRILLSPGDSEKGDVWVTSQGCPVKLALDSELHRRDGSLIEKIHYDESMVKK